MAVKCGWASIDERGSAIGGKAGDQTGREVRLGNWYNFGQSAVYRWKSRTKAERYAKIIEALCNNEHIGYDQGNRTSLDAELKAHGWDPAKVKTNCECDCSSLAVAGVNAEEKKEILSPALYTGNLGAGLMNTGLFEKLTGAKYCGSSDYLMTGDIINRPNSHVIIALANGSKVTSASQKSPAKKKAEKKSVDQVAKEVTAGKWGNEPERSKKLKSAGYTQTEIKQIQQKVNEMSAPYKRKPLKVGAKIRILKGAKQFGKAVGFAPQVYKNTYYVLQISGKRLVFASHNGTVIGAVNSSDCTVV